MFSNRPVVLPLSCQMRQIVNIFTLVVLFLIFSQVLFAQCAVCTKTALQLGEKPAQGMNSGILYLMFMPFIIVGFIGYRWWKGNRRLELQEEAELEQRSGQVSNSL